MTFHITLLLCVVFVLFTLPYNVHSQLIDDESFSRDMPQFVVDLDAPAETRWNFLNTTYYRQQVRDVLAFLESAKFPEEDRKLLQKLSYLLSRYITLESRYEKEVKGVAAALNVSWEQIGFMQIFYEINYGCTSVVAQNEEGRIFHARNLDFGMGSPLTYNLQNVTIGVTFMKGGKVAFDTVTYAGNVGILTAMVPNKFSVSVDARHGGTLTHLLETMLARGLAGGSHYITYLMRDVVESGVSYDEAVQKFSTEKLISRVYFILGGLTAGQGIVLTRDPEKSLYPRQIGAPNTNTTFYVLQTNYDWWLPPNDDRRATGERMMNLLTNQTLSFQGLWNTLSAVPVLNIMTTYSSLMMAGNSTMYSKIRTY